MPQNLVGKSIWALPKKKARKLGKKLPTKTFRSRPKNKTLAVRRAKEADRKK